MAQMLKINATRLSDFVFVSCYSAFNILTVVLKGHLDDLSFVKLLFLLYVKVKRLRMRNTVFV